jgi:peptide/nickel transport system permease protein
MIIKVILSRLATAIITLLAVSIIIFGAIEVLPGDIATRVIGRHATQEQKDEFRRMRHLDDPVYQRYGRWLGSVVQGNFGSSLVNEYEVAGVVWPKVKNTLLLASYAFLLYIPMSMILGVLGAVFRDGPIDTFVSGITLIGLSIPEFVMGTLLLYAFAVKLHVFPVMSVINKAENTTAAIRMMTLPAFTLAVAMAVYAIRMLRDNLIEVLDSEYIRMATLKGMPLAAVVMKHALPNALIPALNVTALNLAYLIGGVVVVEKVFAFPGIGTLLVDSVFLRDAPVIEAAALLISGAYVMANLVADIVTILLNPRLRTAK